MSDVAIIFSYIYSGIIQIVKLIFICAGISLGIGIVAGLIKYRRVPLMNQLIALYIVLMRGIPPLILLLITFFSFNFPSPLLAAIVALSLYHGAYITEIVRGSIEAMPRGQFEAASSVALSSYQTMRYVILPQVWIAIIPPLTGQYVNLIKTTALVSAIGLMGVLSQGRYAILQAGHTAFVYLLVGLFYIIACILLEQLSYLVQNRFS